MQDTKDTCTTVDEYIGRYPADVQERLQVIRAAVKTAAPEAEEGIGYGMPAYRLHGPLVYFGAAKHHIGFYPTPNGIEAFQAELAPYASAKGSAQFPYDQPLPLDLIDKIVRYRVAENMKKAEAKKAKK